MVLGAVIGGGGALLGMGAQKKAQKKMRQRAEKAEGYLDALDPRLSTLFGRAHAESKEGTQRAVSALAGAESGALAHIGVQGKKAGAGVLGSLLQRGFGTSSSVARAGVRGVQTQEGAAIASVFSRLAVPRANIEQRGGFDLARITQNQYGAEADLATEKANLQLGIASSFDASIYQGLGNMASFLSDTGLNDSLMGWLGSLFDDDASGGGAGDLLFQSQGQTSALGYSFT